MIIIIIVVYIIGISIICLSNIVAMYWNVAIINVFFFL